MQVPVHIPRYHTKDAIVMLLSMIPTGVLINYFLFKEDYFSNSGNFLLGCLATFTYLALGFVTYGLVAISLRNRFPDDSDLFKRFAICLCIFFLMSAAHMSILLLIYDYFGFLGYHYYENDFIKCYITLVIVNIFLTFLNEGVYRFERVQAAVTETEQLKKEYMQSQLLGLKSQVSPHFLFNSLNTLSSLIQEDAEKAEDFLDHMSKVYRYLLRNNEEQLVSLDTELSFIKSYYYLLKSRHADGLELDIDVPVEVREEMIPPMTLQMLMESILNNNTLGRDRPLRMKISCNDAFIELSHSIQPKINSRSDNEIIENTANKYRLLCGREIELVDIEKTRIIRLPLIPEQQGGRS